MQIQDAAAVQPVDAKPRPGTLRAAVITYLVAAGLNFAVGAWTLSFTPSTLEQFDRSRQHVQEGVVIAAVASIAVATVAFSVILVVFALRLRSGSQWARPILLTASLLSLVSLLVGGGPAFAVTIVLIVAAVLVTRAPVTAWLRSLRGLSAG